MVSSTTPSSRLHRNFPHFTCFATCNISSENSAKMRRIQHCNKFSKNSIFSLCPDVLIVSSMFNLFNVSRSIDFSHLHALFFLGVDNFCFFSATFSVTTSARFDTFALGPFSWHSGSGGLNYSIEKEKSMAQQQCERAFVLRRRRRRSLLTSFN